MGDKSGIRDRSDGVACGYQSSGPDIEAFRLRLRRMSFGFVVPPSPLARVSSSDRHGEGGCRVRRLLHQPTLAIKNSCDELEEAIGSEISLFPDSRFLVRS
jgi:hypothetical protein